MRLKRALRSAPESDEHEEALEVTQRVFTGLQEMGFGVLGTMEDGSWILRKYDLSSLGASQWAFLRDHRIPAWLFGEPKNGHPSVCREAPRKVGAAETAADAREQKDSKPAKPKYHEFERFGQD